VEHEAIRKLFVAPVKFSDPFGWDANGHMVFCMGISRLGELAWIARGWGRIQYIDRVGVLFKAWEEEFYSLVKAEMTGDEVAAVINSALSEE